MPALIFSRVSTRCAALTAFSTLSPASASRRTILAPPSALMPPWLLISSMAISAPIFLSRPWRAQRPDSGATSAILRRPRRRAPGRARPSGESQEQNPRTSVRMRRGDDHRGVLHLWSDAPGSPDRAAPTISRAWKENLRQAARTSTNERSPSASGLRVPGTAPMPDLERLPSSPIEAAGSSRRRRHPGQPGPQPRHLRGAGPGRRPHVANGAAFPRSPIRSPAVTPPCWASAIQTVEGNAGARGVRHRHRLHVGQHHRPRAPWAPWLEMRACIQSGARELLAGKRRRLPGGKAGTARLCLAGGASRSSWRNFRPRRPSGGGRGRLTGVLLLVGSRSRHRVEIRMALGHLERGAKRAGRKVEDLEVHLGGTNGDYEDRRGSAANGARPTAVHWGILRWGGRLRLSAGARAASARDPRRGARKVYPESPLHAHDWEWAAIKATSPVPDEVVARICDAIGPHRHAGGLRQRARPAHQASEYGTSTRCRSRPSRRPRRVEIARVPRHGVPAAGRAAGLRAALAGPAGG